MKLSEAIEILKELNIDRWRSLEPDKADAVNLAIGCLKFRLNMKDKWGLSVYEMLEGEDAEVTPPQYR